MAREYFCAYHSMIRPMLKLADAERGRLFMALLQYSAGDTPIKLQGREEVAFEIYAEQIDRDAEKYESECQQMQESEPGRADLESLYASLGSWDAVADALGVARSTLWRMRNDVSPTFHDVSRRFKTFQNVSRCFTNETFETNETKEKGEKRESEEKERTKEREEKEIKAQKERQESTPLTGGGKETRFLPPSVADVSAYCAERGNGIDAQRFVDFYAAKGWMIGKNHMKDWKAAVRTWERKNDEQFEQQSIPGTTANGAGEVPEKSEWGLVYDN